MNILIFEGLDKVGKSTLIQTVNKLTNYEYLCIDRLFGSAYVYDLVYKRRDRKIEILQLENELLKLNSTKIFLVHVVCKLATLIERIDNLESDRVKILNKLEYTSSLYEKYFSETQLNILSVDTTNVSVEEAAADIVKRVKTYEHNN